MKHKIYDVVFIGSGISTSFSVINLLDRIEKNKPKRKITIGIVEKYNEFNTGIPYGSRSGYSTLLITSLKDFLIESERSKFIEWLNENKEPLLSKFKSEGGILSEKWLKIHEDQIKKNDWENLYLPRRFFGRYIDEKIIKKIEKLSREKAIDVDFIKGEVMDLNKLPSHYELKLGNGSLLQASKAVLSIGSLPINFIYKTEDLLEEKDFMLINSPYHPELNTNLDKAISFLSKRHSKETNVLIIGANASALELLYKLNDTFTANSKTNFNFLSSQGLLPDSQKEGIRRTFIPENLKKLRSEAVITSKAIANAAFKDLDSAESKNLGAAFTVNIISKHINDLLKRLSTEELENFACFHGNQIGRRQRCAGKHYIDTINILNKENRFNHIAGRFVDIIESENNGYLLKYLETSSSEEKISETPYHLIINCVGSINFENENLPIVLKNAMRKGLIEANESKIGLRVNSTSLEASKNLHIMGPLLAGNVIENNAVWHVEHCGRIIWLSKILAKEIYSNLTPN